MKILVIIPAFNEENSIIQVISKLKIDYPEADYIVINDCSKDNTVTVLKDNDCNYLDLPMNLGIGGGVQSGYKYAFQHGYDIAIQIDGDGQHDTAFLSRVIEPLISQEADICIGSRFIEKKGFQSTGMRRLGINFLSGLIKIFGRIKIYDVTSGYRAVNAEYIKVYSQNYPVDYPEPEAIVQAAKREARIREIPVEMKERSAGKSSIRAWKTVYYMIKVSLSIILCSISAERKKK